MACKKVIHLTIESANNHALVLEGEYGVKPNIYPCKEHGNITVYHVGYEARQRKNFTSANSTRYKKAHTKEKSTEYRNKKDNRIVTEEKQDQKVAYTHEGIENIFLKLVNPPVDRVLARKITSIVDTILPIIEKNAWQISIGGTSYAKSSGKASNVRIYLEKLGNVRHTEGYESKVVKMWKWDRLTNTGYGTISQDTMYTFLKEIVEVVQSEDIKRLIADPLTTPPKEDMTDPIEEHLTELLFGLVQIPSTKLRARVHEVAQEATPLLKKHKLTLQFCDKKVYPYRLRLEYEPSRKEVKTWDLKHVNGMPVGKVKEFELFQFMDNFISTLAYPSPLKMPVLSYENGALAKREPQKQDTAYSQTDGAIMPALVSTPMENSVAPKSEKQTSGTSLPVPKRHIIATAIAGNNGDQPCEIKVEFFSEQGLKFLKDSQKFYWGQYKPTPPNKVSIFVNPDIWNVEDIINYINQFVPATKEVVNKR